MKKPTQQEIDAETTRIARQYGCDRGTFTVCWGEIEKGLVCRCKQEAIAALQKQPSERRRGK